MNEHTLHDWLSKFIAQQGGVAGTLHLLEGDLLVLAAAVNIPPKVQEVTRSIPKGKGMAGLAWERDRPITTCNLKEDASGAVKPGARAVDAKAAVALPVHAAGGELRAVVGIAYPDERDLSEADLARLAEAAATAPILAPRRP
jgi:L-methionine (R)-S-oxide reductase